MHGRNKQHLVIINLAPLPGIFNKSFIFPVTNGTKSLSTSRTGRVDALKATPEDNESDTEEKVPGCRTKLASHFQMRI